MQHPTSPRGRSAAARLGGVVLAAASLTLVPAPASAHGIGGEAADRSILGFVPLGMEHMLLGWDHLFFIGGVVLLAGGWRRAAKLVTVFVLGHSATLIAATLAGWRVDAGLVDVVIALSVVFVGAVGIFVTRPKWNVFGAIVLAFGLVHGLGLSTRLQEVGLPDEGALWRVIAFNVGIELGQLTALMAMVALATALSMALGRDREPAMKKLASATLFVGGAVASGLVAGQAFTAGPEQEGVAAEDVGSGCSVSARTEGFAGAGGHAAKSFYEPGEAAPMGDFGHSLGDGYVVVLYPPTLEEAAVGELRTFVTGPEGRGILAGPATDMAEPLTEVKAITMNQTLTCETVQLEALRKFTAEWFASMQ